MSKMIQIRNVPDEVHKSLRVRAAKRGTSLSEYLLREIEDVLQRPSIEELVERIDRRAKVKGPVDSAVLVRAERDRR